eukprot:m51a1_g14521 hypothetical protein (2403) ;mRNA; f:897645-908580
MPPAEGLPSCAEWDLVQGGVLRRVTDARDLVSLAVASALLAPACCSALGRLLPGTASAALLDSAVEWCSHCAQRSVDEISRCMHFAWDSRLMAGTAAWCFTRAARTGDSEVGEAVAGLLRHFSAGHSVEASTCCMSHLCVALAWRMGSALDVLAEHWHHSDCGNVGHELAPQQPLAVLLSASVPPPVDRSGLSELSRRVARELAAQRSAYVSADAVCAGVARALGRGLWRELGVDAQAVAAVVAHRRLEERCAAFVEAALAVNPVATAWEIGSDLAAAEHRGAYEELCLGPLGRHPLVVKYFCLADRPEVVDFPAVTRLDIAKELCAMVKAHPGAFVQPTDLISRMAAAHGVQDPLLLGIRINENSLGLYLSPIFSNKRQMWADLKAFRESNKAAVDAERRALEQAHAGAMAQSLQRWKEAILQNTFAAPAPSGCVLPLVHPEADSARLFLRYWRCESARAKKKALAGMPAAMAATQTLEVDGRRCSVAPIRGTLLWVAVLLLRRAPSLSERQLADAGAGAFVKYWSSVAAKLPMLELRNVLGMSSGDAQMSLCGDREQNLPNLAFAYVRLFPRGDEDDFGVGQNSSAPGTALQRTEVVLNSVDIAIQRAKSQARRNGQPLSLADLSAVQGAVEQTLNARFEDAAGVGFLQYLHDNSEALDLRLSSLFDQRSAGGSAGVGGSEALLPTSDEVFRALEVAVAQTPGAAGEAAFLAAVEGAAAKTLHRTRFSEVTEGGYSLAELSLQDTRVQELLAARRRRASDDLSAESLRTVAAQCMRAARGKSLSDQTAAAGAALCAFYGVSRVEDLGHGSLATLISSELQGDHSRAEASSSFATVAELVSGDDGVAVTQAPECTPEQIAKMLLSAPVLRDIEDWLQWRLVFFPSLGPLPQWLRSNADQLPASLVLLEESPGHFVRLDATASESGFAEAATSGSAIGVASQLVSLIHKDRKEVSAGVLAQHFACVLSALLQTSKPQEVASFVLKCLEAVPRTLCLQSPTVWDVFVRPFFAQVPQGTKVLRSACCTTAHLALLQAFGVRRGMPEWRDLYPSIPTGCTAEASPAQYVTVARGQEFPKPDNAQASGAYTGAPAKCDGDQTAQASGKGADTASQEGPLLLRPQATREHCRAVIERIRAEAARLEAAQAQRLVESMGSAVEKLSGSLYSKDTHFVLELIQNADDNSYPDNVVPEVEFTLGGDCVTLRNNELGFRDSDIEALCSVGHSTKKRTAGKYIGRKGIGFKSVFRVTKCPHLRSGGYSILFDADDGPLGLINPRWDESEEATRVPLGVTEITLPLREEMAARQAQGLRVRFGEVAPSLLMFLKRLRRIVISDQVDGTCRVMEKRESVIAETEDRCRCSLVQLQSHEGASRERLRPLGSEDWIVTSCVFACEQGIHHPEDDTQTDTEVSVALPLLPAGQQPEYQKTFAYLPLKSYNLRFIVQADWLTPPTREDIDGDRPWNEWLRSKVHLVFARALAALRSHLEASGVSPVEVVSRIVDLLPVASDVHEFFRPVARAIVERMRIDPWLVTQSGERARPGDVLEQPQDCPVSETLLLQTLHKRFLHRDVKLRSRSQGLADTLGVIAFSPVNLVGVLTALCHSDGSGEHMPLESVDSRALMSWLDWIYVQLRASHGGQAQDLRSKLSALPIFRVARLDGPEGQVRHVCPRGAAVFLPTDSGTVARMRRYAFSKGLEVLSSGMVSALNTKLLSELGALEFCDHEVIRNCIRPILLEQQSPLQPGSGVDQTLVSQVLFLADHLRACTLCSNAKGHMMEELRSKLRVYDSEGTLSLCSELYLGRPYFESVLERSFQHSVAAIKFVSTVYSQQVSAESDLRSFFSDLGARTFFKPSKVTRVVTVEELCKSTVWNTQGLVLQFQKYVVEDVVCEDLRALMCLAEQRKVSIAAMRAVVAELSRRWLSDWNGNLSAAFYAPDQSSSGDTPIRGRFIMMRQSTLSHELRTMKWFPSTAGLYAPQELLLPTEEIRTVMSVFANYAETTNVCEEMLRDLRISDTVRAEGLAEILNRWSSYGRLPTTVEHMAEVYRFLALRLSDRNIQRQLPSTVFVPSAEKEGRFLPVSECCQKDPLQLIGPGMQCPVHVLSHFYEETAELAQYFTTIEVRPVPRLRHYVAGLVSLCESSSKVPFDRACDCVSLVFRWASACRLSITPKSVIKHLAGAPVFPTRDHKWVRGAVQSPDSPVPVIAEDEEICQVFSKCDGLAILENSVPWRECDVIVDALQIPLLDAVATRRPVTESTSPYSETAEQMEPLVGLLHRVVFYTARAQFDAMLASGVCEALQGLRFFEATGLTVVTEVSLPNANGRTFSVGAKADCYLSNEVMLIDRGCSLAAALRMLLGHIFLGVKDRIDTVVDLLIEISHAPTDAEAILKKHGVRQFPKSLTRMKRL